ncbi:MAG: hypothetical protein RIQ89_915 [Bacteroidota bacterium]
MYAKNNSITLSIHGHRGCRGLMPENSLAAFRHAAEIGVDYLELDVVIADGQRVLISHEPWFNPEITTIPHGLQLKSEDLQLVNFFNSRIDFIQQFDCGIKPHPRFLEQEKVTVQKPLLIDLINMLSSNHMEHIGLNIEIKSSLEQEQRGFQPPFHLFVDLVVRELMAGNCKKVILQSFDIRVLQYLQTLHLPFDLAFLVEYDENYRHQIDLLGFFPHVYAPHYSYVSAEMVNDLHSDQIKVIPWTVNNLNVINKMIALNVDGIISDYPDRVLMALNRS